MPRYFMGSDGTIVGEDEIVGGDPRTLVSGYDYNQMFGAGDAAPPGVNLAQVAAARAAGGLVVQKKEPTELREQTLPFFQDFTASLVDSVNLTPQRLFRPERLSFASLTAQYFLITGVSIAQEPQFVAEGGTLAQLFSEVAVGMRLKGRTANLGAQIVINAKNIDADNTRTLYGAFVGPAAM